jgi:nicotinamide-nucleotide amidase
MTVPPDAALMELAAAAGARLAAAGETLVTAESCTGGWIAKACTDVPGSSLWFLGGVVAYADSVKRQILGVDPDTIQRHGAVSEPVVRAMAEGALQSIGAATWAIAVSGVAGPDGGTTDKPVGTVWLAWARRQQDGSLRTETCREQFPGGRDEVRRRTVRRALVRLLGA